MVNAQQLAALTALYTSTNGPNWNDNLNWYNGGDPCDATNGWYGVSCDAAKSNVIHLELENNNLEGTLPTEIGLLTGIKTGLKLFSNKLHGPIPSELG